MDYDDFEELYKHIDEEKADRKRDGYINAAFGAWLNGAAPKGARFDSWLSDLGLKKKEKITVENKKEMVDEALEIARKIVDADRMGK